VAFRRVRGGRSAPESIATFEPPSVASGGFEALLFKAGELVSQVLMVVVTGRLMGPSGRGLYALASLSVGICQVPFGSVWIANAVELARKRGVSIIVAAGGGAVTCLVALAVSPLFGDRWWVFALPSLITPFVLLRAYQEGLWQAIGHVRAVNLLRLGRAFLPFLFILPPLLADASARTAIIVWELAFVLLAITAYFRLRAFLGAPEFPRDRGIYRRVAKYGLTISGFRIVEVLNERNGLLALAIFSSDAAVGVFSIAVAATEVLLLATEALALSTFRRISSDTREASAALTIRTMRHCVMLVAAASVAVIPTVYVTLPWVLGPGYGEVPALLLLLTPNVLCASPPSGRCTASSRSRPRSRHPSTGSWRPRSPSTPCSTSPSSRCGERPGPPWPHPRAGSSRSSSPSRRSPPRPGRTSPTCARDVRTSTPTSRSPARCCGAGGHDPPTRAGSRAPPALAGPVRPPERRRGRWRGPRQAGCAS
jgi:hypothetical protein